VTAQKGEREEALLKWAAAFVADVEARGGIPPLHVSGDAMNDICRALLSSSAAEGEMREALESLVDAIRSGEDGELYGALERAEAALKEPS